ncbi:bifunctional Aspartate-other aminotransferase/Pyridoxal phosphate-dependent transferase [Babesia duncani]|nr:bifunctional Aspartate-other aminotransferase/Pyridoxal phosphate-dependent transferase [Babesia duncani]
MLSSLKKLQRHDVVILQACAHNPTGYDPSQEEWVEIKSLIKQKELIPLIDIAYQGFATGDLRLDSFVVREFARDNMTTFVAQSFSKNMGLYSARVGMLHVIMMQEEVHLKQRLLSNLQMTNRAISGSPSRHGSEIGYRILTDPALRIQWVEQVKEMADRIKYLRKLIKTKLEQSKVVGPWDHLEKQTGMFAYLGISKEAVAKLKVKHHVYMTADARISVTGINEKNVDTFINAMAAVLGTHA